MDDLTATNKTNRTNDDLYLTPNQSEDGSEVAYKQDENDESPSSTFTYLTLPYNHGYNILSFGLLTTNHYFISFDWLIYMYR
jgi:hypothetical protein